MTRCGEKSVEMVTEPEAGATNLYQTVLLVFVYQRPMAPGFGSLVWVVAPLLLVEIWVLPTVKRVALAASSLAGRVVKLFGPA